MFESAPGVRFTILVSQARLRHIDLKGSLMSFPELKQPKFQEPRLVTWVTESHCRLACNWLTSLQLLGMDQLATVYCAEDRTVERLSKFLAVSDSAACIDLTVDNALVNGSHVWGTLNFSRLMVSKLDLLFRLASGGVPFVFSDADAAFLKDPFYGDAALENVETDEVCPRSGARRTRMFFHSDAPFGKLATPAASQLCTGLIYCPSGDCAHVFQVARAFLVRHLQENRGQETSFTDQNAVSGAIQFLCAPWGVLPDTHWKNGLMEWGVEQEQTNEEPIFVHANWVIGATNKEQRLRQSNCWFVREDHLQECGL